MFPAKRRKVWKAIGRHWRSLPFERRNSLFQIDGIPQDNGGNDQIEAAGLVLQILPEPIANRAAPVKENRTS